MWGGGGVREYAQIAHAHAHERLSTLRALFLVRALAAVNTLTRGLKVGTVWVNAYNLVSKLDMGGRCNSVVNAQQSYTWMCCGGVGCGMVGGRGGSDTVSFGFVSFFSICAIDADK